MKTVAIHQPNYLPWLGYFYKISCSDVFVILDDVDYQSGNATSLTNRTRIKGPNGVFWLTVPVKSKNKSRLIHDIQIDDSQDWQTKQEKTLNNFYGNHAYYSKYAEPIYKVIRKNYHSLSSLNTDLITLICEILEIKTQILISSNLGIFPAHKDEKIAALCKELGASHYLSGSGAKKYNRPEVFQTAGIELSYTNFVHPEYSQKYGPFVPGLSIIDSLFSCGPELGNTLMLHK